MITFKLTEDEARIVASALRSTQNLIWPGSVLPELQSEEWQKMFFSTKKKFL